MDNKENIVVRGIKVRYRNINEEDYICLTDIAKVKNELFPADVVKNWLRTRSTLEYLKLWEMFYNPDVKLVEIDQFGKFYIQIIKHFASDIIVGRKVFFYYKIAWV